MRQIGQIVLLGLQKILKERSRTDDPAVIISKPQSCKGRDAEMFQQFISAQLIIKIPGVKGIDRDTQPVFEIVQVHPAHIERLIADDL